jgi:thiol-disulfide isomerase/thioredoxin
MYRVLYVVLIAGIFAACQSTGPGAGLSGTLTGVSGETIYLERFANEKVVKTDSSEVASDGSFSLDVSPALQLDYYRLSVGDKNFWVITDSTENLVINGDAENLLDATVQGSQNTMLLFDLNKQTQPKIEAIMDIREQLKQPGVQIGERTELTNELKTKMQEMRQVCLNFIKDNTASPAILHACTMLDKSKDLKTYEKTLKAMESVVGHSFYYRGVQMEYQAAKKTQDFQKQATSGSGGFERGTEAPELSFPDPEGNMRSLTDLKGKVVLLDFWASWCRPCRAENPNVVKAYNKYKSKGFEVFSVSLDNSPDKWQAAILQDGLVWPNHVSDLKGWKSAAASIYGVRSIPFTVLIDQEGKIQATNLRGPALEAKLAEILDA